MTGGGCEQDPDEDELFKLTTKGGKLEIEREKVRTLAEPAVAAGAPASWRGP